MIQRAEQFSPNSVEKDLAILEAVAERLRQKGHEIFTVPEDDPRGQGNTWGSSLLVLPQCIFSMSRLPATLYWLKTFHGIPIINSPEGVENCTRSTLETIMTQIGTPMPPKEGQDGYWLKRGDAAAQSKDDVVFAADSEALKQAITTMQQRGITSYTVSAHVKGDLVKFYGVCDTGFFRYFYPTDDGKTKVFHSRKLDALEDMIEAANGKPVMVVYWFKSDLARIEERLREKGVTFERLDTGDSIERWNRGEIPVLLLSPASAAHGLNLQSGGSHIIWFGLTWSLELYQQTNGRLWRQGQKSKTVVVNHIVLSGSIDERILHVLKNKDATQEELIYAVKAEVK